MQLYRIKTCLCAIFLTVTFSIQAQSFKETERFKEFFETDMPRLTYSDSVTSQGETFMVKADGLFKEIDSLSRLSAEVTDPGDKNKLDREVSEKQKQAYQLQFEGYKNFKESNEIKYSVYTKHLEIFWQKATEAEIPQREKIKNKTYGNFERAKLFRQMANNLPEKPKSESLKKADSLEIEAITILEESVEWYLKKLPGSVKSPKFRDTEEFRTLLKYEMKSLNEADTLIKKGDSLISKAKILHLQVSDARLLAENIKRKRKRKKQLQKATKLENEAYRKDLSGHSFYKEANTIKYEIYSKYIVDFRIKADPTRLAQGIKQEAETRGNWKQSENLRYKANRSAKKDKLRLLQQADSLENTVLENMEVVLGIYNDYNRIEKDIDIQIAEEDLNELDYKLAQLILSNPDERVWTSDIQRKHDKIVDLRKRIDEDKDPRIKNIYLDQVLLLEREEARLLEDRVKHYEYRNEYRFKEYKDITSQISKIPSSSDSYRTALNAEKQSGDNYRIAKTKIQKAYVSLNELLPKLEATNDEVAPLKEFSHFGVLKYRQNKYDVAVLLLEANELEEESAKLIENIKEIYEKLNISLYQTIPNNQKTTNNEQKKNTNNTKTIKKTTKKSTRYPKSGQVVFKVQFASFKTEQPHSKFSKYSTAISHEKMTDSDWIAYLEGKYTSPANVEAALAKAKKAGYNDAFIVSYLNGKRVPYHVAKKKLTGKSGTSSSAKYNYTTEITVDLKNKDKIVKGTNIANIKGLVFTVQVGYSEKPLKSANLKNITPVYEDRNSKGIIRYTVGIFKDEATAVKARDKIKKLGISDAFVTPYYNGKRIDFDKARSIARSGKSNSTTSANASNNEIQYKIQVAAGKSEPSAKEMALFKKLATTGKLENHTEGSFTIYTIGGYKDYNKALEAKKTINNKGIKDAFIIAFQGSRKISVRKARKLQK